MWHFRRIEFFWLIMQPVVVISYRRFGTTYRSYSPGSRNLERMGPIGYPETSVRNCHYWLRNKPEKRSPQGTSRRKPEITPGISGIKIKTVTV
jgi:hypothetical protein